MKGWHSLIGYPTFMINLAYVRISNYSNPYPGFYP